MNGKRFADWWGMAGLVMALAAGPAGAATYVPDTLVVTGPGLVQAPLGQLVINVGGKSQTLSGAIVNAAASAPGCFGVAGSLCNVGSGATGLTDGTTPLYFSRIGPAQAPSGGEWQIASANLGNVTALRDLYYDGTDFGFSAQTVRSIWGYEHGAFGCDEGGTTRATTVSANVTIAGNVMTVAAGLTGTIAAGMDILITGLYTGGTPGPLPMVVQQLSGTTGGAGTYEISSATGDPRALNVSVPSSTSATMGVDPTISCSRTFIEASNGLTGSSQPNDFTIVQTYGATNAQHNMFQITQAGNGDNVGDMYWDRTSGGAGNILHSLHSSGFLAISGTVSGTGPVDAFDVYLSSGNCMVVGRETINRGACSYGVNGEDLEIHSATPIVRWRVDSTAIADMFLDSANKRLGVMDPITSSTAAPVWFYVDGTQNVWLQGGVQVGAPTGGFKGAGTVNAAGVYYANGTAGVSCAAASVSLTTLVVSNGIITHC